MNVITRFAPSPTGHLHIGGARTALFNWLFAKANGGKFLLRIEDTDRKRSTSEAKHAILEGLQWLNLQWDDEPVSQYSRQAKHIEMAYNLLEKGRAYKCFSTSEEIDHYRETVHNKRSTTFFVSPWRDVLAKNHPHKPYTIRMKTPQDGMSSIEDIVQGEVSVKQETIDDFIILRSDGTPTYNFAVVVDDHDMKVSHIIRGSDHMVNTFKQKLIYEGFNWVLPKFAHIPLIHNESGKKFSKRDGAEGVETFFDLGVTPEAACNFLARLGWSHGDDEFFNMDQAISWFRLEDLRKSPSRYDPKILLNLSGRHLAKMDNHVLLKHLKDFVAKKFQTTVNPHIEQMIQKAIPLLRERSKTLVDLWQDLSFLFFSLGEVDTKTQQEIQKLEIQPFEQFCSELEKQDWNKDSLFQFAKEFSGRNGSSLGKVVQPVRLALTGKTNSPSVFDLFVIIGREDSLNRLNQFLNHLKTRVFTNYSG